MATTALITGATSGIGKATAQLFAKQGLNLILCGRRKERLEALKRELGNDVNIATLSFDVRDRKAVFETLHELPDGFEHIDMLINNAGNAHGLAYIHEGNPDDWDAMIDINVKGLLYVTRAILPGMVERNSGHVINIGSMAGRDAYPMGNVYVASKYAVDGLTKSMRQDLLGTGVQVTSINPGLVETEFSVVRFKGDEERAKTAYQGYQPLKPEDVADTIWFAVSRPPHVNIADLLVLPSDQATSTMVDKGE